MDIYSKKLFLIEESLNKLNQLKKENLTLDKYRNSWKDKDAVERNLQKIVEAIIDLGKMIIADNKYREPGNNREVFLILEENGSFPANYLPLMDMMIGMRNIIVHSYERIDDAIVFEVLQKGLKDIKKIKLYFARLIKEINKNI